MAIVRFPKFRNRCSLQCFNLNKYYQGHIASYPACCMHVLLCLLIYMCSCHCYFNLFYCSWWCELRIAINTKPIYAEKLQQNIDFVFTWANIWQMKFNISKCCYMHISQATKYKIGTQYTLCNTPLAPCSQCKYLDVIIQSDLK